MEGKELEARRHRDNGCETNEAGYSRRGGINKRDALLVHVALSHRIQPCKY